MIEQFGVLPYRIAAGGDVEVLLVTSRNTGRWIVPKGNKGIALSASRSAAQEAYEEAGVEGEVADDAIGHYHYAKHRLGGLFASPATVAIFPMRVTRQLDAWPEQGQRSRRWFGKAEAAAAVGEDSLRALILAFEA